MIKNTITSKFNKDDFDIPYGSNNEEPNTWECVDEYIRDFIIKLNSSPHIMTEFSCEGHKEGGEAYVAFKLDSDGWDIYWNRVLPQIDSEKVFDIIDDNINAQYLLGIMNNISGDKIVLRLTLKNDTGMYHEKKWEEKKKLFWSILDCAFTEHYKL